MKISHCIEVTVPVLAFAFFLGGCATSTGLRAGKPAYEESSERTAAATAACIADRWRHTPSMSTADSAGVALDEGADNYTVYWRNPVSRQVVALADVTAAGTGSKTRYFQEALPDERRFDDAVKDCQ